YTTGAGWTSVRHKSSLLAGSSRTCRARRHALGILPNGITPAEQAVTNEIVARLRDHALSRAPRTNGLSAFSTRHVPRHLYPVPPFHRKLLPVIPPQGGVPALCGDCPGPSAYERVAGTERRVVITGERIRCRRPATWRGSGGGGLAVRRRPRPGHAVVLRPWAVGTRAA